jgi:hypothetical protein
MPSPPTRFSKPLLLKKCTQANESLPAHYIWLLHGAGPSILVFAANGQDIPILQELASLRERMLTCTYLQSE